MPTRDCSQYLPTDLGGYPPKPKQYQRPTPEHWHNVLTESFRDENSENGQCKRFAFR
ncbi:hypothetical protein CY34DRAFT_807659 [Suillus luteus UH-Slu-Lm8-n1]|uniref:Uncharacterized protein n=1 Tax=Suillus luteus UH-Slu-Lm8-n1 TaxID=930992 RepID=A0A0D0B8F4_9AGAM|nr:hypothetical protein CY34DRAFT_807659 [Suillus luteus UH-Slu-Lm8-n1]